MLRTQFGLAYLAERCTGQGIDDDQPFGRLLLRQAGGGEVTS
jgi:hypothetical protein